MRFKVGAVILAGALLGTAALIPGVSEGRGGSGGGRGTGSQQCRQQNQNCPQDGQRLRDGSCGNKECPQQGQRGSCAGPNGGVRGRTVRGGADVPPDAK